MKYLEIGTLYGANLFSVVNLYGKHPKSQFHCIDPWIDYDDYSEYKNEQPNIYKTFCKNLENFPEKNKIHVHRGFSHQILQTFPDKYFDVIYIDGNHEPEFVMEDAVASHRKLKSTGIMIFDDYGYGRSFETQMAIDGFTNAYHKHYEKLCLQNSQLFLLKK